MPSIEEIINRQFRQWEMEKNKREELPPVSEPPMEIVTVSREHGSRGAYFAKLLAEGMGFQLIHKEIVDAICQYTGYRKRIIESLDEHYRSRLELTVATRQDSLHTATAGHFSSGCSSRMRDSNRSRSSPRNRGQCWGSMKGLGE